MQWAFFRCIPQLNEYQAQLLSVVGVVDVVGVVGCQLSLLVVSVVGCLWLA